MKSEMVFLGLLRSSILPVFIIGSCLLVGCGYDKKSELSEQEKASVADSIKVLIEDANRAWQNLDAAAYMDYYSPEAHFYYQGSHYSYDEFEEIVHNYLGQLRESSITMQESNIEVLGSRAAIISYEYSGYNADTTGRVDSAKAAFTAVFKKEEGNWKIIQAHESMATSEGDE